VRVDLPPPPPRLAQVRAGTQRLPPTLLAWLWGVARAALPLPVSSPAALWPDSSSPSLLASSPLRASSPAIATGPHSSPALSHFTGSLQLPSLRSSAPGAPRRASPLAHHPALTEPAWVDLAPLPASSALATTLATIQEAVAASQERQCAASLALEHEHAMAPL
jgi:hypothetical protein